METNPTPDPEQARAALDAATRAESAIRATRTLSWLVSVNAALLALATLALLAPRLPAMIMIGIGLLVIIINVLAIVPPRRVFGSVPAPNNRALVLAYLLAAIVIAAAAATYRSTGAEWIVVGAAVLVAVLVLAGGWAHRRSVAAAASTPTP